MRVVVQRVKQARVRINGGETRSIGSGMLILLGVEDGDGLEDIHWLCEKLTHLRIFNDDNGIMNLPIDAVGGEFMVISQFTLHASTRKGNRPSYVRAARPEIAKPLYDEFRTRLQQTSKRPVLAGEFGAYMEVELVNDGPVTIIIDSKQRE